MLIVENIQTANRKSFKKFSKNAIVKNKYAYLCR